MCFKNLPVEFDENGKAHLKEGFAEAYDTQRTRPRELPRMSEDRVRELLGRNGFIQEFNIDPVTRVAGALAFHTVTDLRERRVVETNSLATLFRGYEVILKGRDPRDAIFISSRACGVCGGVHSTTSAMALEMAFGVRPPPLGIVLRNLALAFEYLYDHPLHLGLLAGPDYSQTAVQDTNPEVWERAEKTAAGRSQWHGYRTVGDIMRDLNPLTGAIYLEALEMTRVAREAYVLVGGKYPHPQTIVPGGMAVTVSHTTFNEAYTRLVRFFDYSKKVVALWDDLTDFFYEVNPDYRRVGARPANLLDLGQWDDPEAYDATFANADAWGERRWATPGVIVDGELRTTRLQQIDMGVEEFVEHSFYEDWTGAGRQAPYQSDPGGNPVSPYHMWNKETKPRPGATSWKEKYTWDTAPRWDRMSMEAGAYVRLWNAALARKVPTNDFIESTGHSVKLAMPAAELPRQELEWQVPQQWGAFERNRGRAYCLAYTTMVAMNELVRGWDLMKRGETATSTKFEIPKGERRGVGYWGAGRGYLSHHAVIDRGVIQNYQILTPSTWNASPKDPFSNPGPYEEAVLNTPLLENFERPEDFKGID
ncbi:MAG: nickel-dependent hydrogenase large subunit, partial [Candidatus Dormibacteraeota bacterium]|nr:nickel-dependent hydrogenase large subunit [Candidatus Dormibacteraeota bacterium]